MIVSDATSNEARMNQVTQNTTTNILVNPSLQLFVTIAKTMERTIKIAGDNTKPATNSGIRYAWASAVHPIPITVAMSENPLRRMINAA